MFEFTALEDLIENLGTRNGGFGADFKQFRKDCPYGKLYVRARVNRIY